MLEKKENPFRSGSGRNLCSHRSEKPAKIDLRFRGIKQAIQFYTGPLEDDMLTNQRLCSRRRTIPVKTS